MTTGTAVEICRTLRGIAIDIRKVPGTALKDQITGKVVYMPPEGEDRLRGVLANWERFLHDATDLDPLIRMAVGITSSAALAGGRVVVASTDGVVYCFS